MSKTNATVILEADTTKISEAFQRVRYTMSPFNQALRDISRYVEAHIKAEARVANNKATVLIFAAAERLYEIDQGVKAGTHDSWGYEIKEQESK